MKHRSTLLLLPALLGIAACDEPGTGVSAGGEYRVVLESPHADDGAAAIELDGGGIESVTAAAGTRVFSQAAGGTTRLVVVREPAGPIELRVTLAAGSELPRARVTEVADGNDLPRASLDGYRVTFQR